MGGRMKVLVMSSRIPFPLEKGDKLRLFHQLKHLSKEHEVILCCLSSKDASLEQKEALSPWVHELHVYRLSWMRRLWRMAWAWASDKPFQVVWFTEPRVQRQIRDLSVRCAPDVIYGQLVRCAEYVKDLHEVPKVLDYMDALSAGMHRRANNETRLFMKAYQWLLRTEGTRLARYESRVLDYFDGATIISRNDRLLIPHGDRDRIQLVPNGVDLSTFSPAESAPEGDPVLLFTGNMSYAPNVDAAHHLVEHILPLVKHPHVRVVLAGAQPKASVQALASNRVTVTGWVDDIAAEYRAATLFVAPLRIGTGLQNKVLEAMAAEVPCVLSP
ncbi:MAG: glycosyltransferase, partial [Flavobacteriales bacterium]|nr:glycosyltransferase [Flavobacteriales bacterium]